MIFCLNLIRGIVYQKLVQPALLGPVEDGLLSVWQNVLFGWPRTAHTHPAYTNTYSAYIYRQKIAITIINCKVIIKRLNIWKNLKNTRHRNPHTPILLRAETNRRQHFLKRQQILSRYKTDIQIYYIVNTTYFQVGIKTNKFAKY